MLQQTRVAAVLGYYERFLGAFPTVEALAAAPEEQLMKLWEGLGYYSRARNLQKAARTVVEQGGFPDTYESLLKLPGVGDYTAGAIASAAFGLPYPAVDGNVLRVMMRLTDCRGDIADGSVKAAVRTALAQIMPEKQEEIRIFNQALMELGATVCLPNGEPKCGACPMREQCLACSRGTAMSLPVKSGKKPRRKEEKTVYVLLQEGRVALRRRDESGLLAGLWEFPNLGEKLDEERAAEGLAQWGLTAKAWHKKLSAKHIFTHVEWHMTGYVLEVEGTGREDFLWMDPQGLRSHAVPSAFGKFYDEACAAIEQEE
jgi:A/G-specific adenine glycosylase